MNYSDYSAQWSSKRSSNQHFAHDFLEKPAIYSLLPNLEGLSVLCLGCGSGEECEELYQRGATRVVGIDNAEGLIDWAKNSYPHLEFEVADMLNLHYPQASFDLVFSSLAFHYIENWDNLFATIRNVLKPGGSCIFSTHHPIKWGSQSIKNKEYTQFLMGYKKIKSPHLSSQSTNKITQNYTIFGDYLTKRPINETLFGNLEITHYHRPISDMINTFLNAGFSINSMLEPLPVSESASAKPDFYEVHSRIPLFVLFSLRLK